MSKTAEHIRYVVKLERENAELRELVRDMYEWAWHEYPSSVEESFLPRLRGLGIEVDDAS